jgi:uncharacterized protein YecE (DUF72 family)
MDDEVIRVGVAGWSYPDWEGIVYPAPHPPRFDPLGFLARYFDTIELNNTFYRPPARSAALSWARRVREFPDFRFTAKLYKAFTHERQPTPSDEKAVKEGLAPLLDAGRLGALLLQFPWSFKNEPDSCVYLQSLVDRFREFPLVVEVRHASWNQPEFYHYLADRAVGFCNIDQPRLGRSLGPSEKATGPVGYVRLHGRNYQDWFREGAGRDARYDYLYSEEELEPWLQNIHTVAESSAETFVITNNHYRGQAAVNAIQIKAKLRGRRVEAPASLVATYPVLENSVKTASETPQPKLF